MEDALTALYRHPEQPIETDLSITADLFIKSHRVPRANTILPQHSHSYAHVSVIAYGQVDVWEENTFVGTLFAPASVKIAAKRKHTFITKVDNTVILCVHRIDKDGGPEVYEENSLGV